jgi:hypothetical protein
MSEIAVGLSRWTVDFQGITQFQEALTTELNARLENGRVLLDCDGTHKGTRMACARCVADKRQATAMADLLIQRFTLAGMLCSCAILYNQVAHKIVARPCLSGDFLTVR